MLSSSHLKIHKPHVTGVFPRPTDDSTRNCETRGDLSGSNTRLRALMP